MPTVGFGGFPLGRTGGSGAIVPIQVIQVVTAQATLPFSSVIPTFGYRNLRMCAQLRGDTAATTTTVVLTFNGDTGANYNWERTSATGSSTASAESLSQASIEVANMPAASATSGRATLLEVFIAGFLDTNFHKSLYATSHFSYNDSTANTQHRTYSGTWRSSAAITSITLAPGAGNFAPGTYICLYAERDF